MKEPFGKFDNWQQIYKQSSFLWNYMCPQNNVLRKNLGCNKKNVPL